MTQIIDLTFGIPEFNCFVTRIDEGDDTPSAIVITVLQTLSYGQGDAACATVKFALPEQERLFDMIS